MKIRKLWWWLRLLLRRPFFNKIGKSSYLGPSVSLIGTKNITIGNQVRIFPGNRMETYNSGTIIIEDNCSIGQNFHIISDKTNLLIGKNTTISGNVFITNVNHSYEKIDIHILEQPMKNIETTIGDNCFIGFGVAIQAGTKLGKQCIVGSNSVVKGEFPDYSVIVGSPAKIIKTFNKETLQWEKV
ncbi:acyltransferase [Streptococcus sp. CSL10205-OR2]|uniref:acyltransferase n=1 Tax=Streptococcus sp. CSL10205-OR2 TaxID=2980558 RepID=UPI0021D7D5D7|nr:acyltransferase [Streptococcus sp. CSL10205-OR2]MCU9533608.1 acyltransferase [Streptococcus sp. CSL10205-OR2]